MMIHRHQLTLRCQCLSCAWRRWWSPSVSSSECPLPPSSRPGQCLASCVWVCESADLTARRQ